ncbi:MULTISPECIES: YcaO-like family protein [unclassified Rathayibacter]|uniref:YcaO-like family protein n=1 Tax=unclassified Rathayibacter TaxID=2609250 RepID=UPI001889E8A4|nr:MULTISPECIES: YcaO-like family protein [unclassified Rathayibacter]MBF4461834.1 YcaO-like family protein [Rathayibacter sp. VKM Ac-2879]MBF4503247.1 YcaO-like family protein [Rathayibacter sp. VKM Ac-2878]
MPDSVRTLDPLTGIAEAVSVLPPRSETPLWQVVVQLKRPTAPTVAGSLGLVGASDLTRRGAMRRAAGEAVERFALLPRPDETGAPRATSGLELLYDAERPLDVAGEATPSGAAAGGSHAEAAHAAVLELVERDALLVAWGRQLALARIDPSPCPAVARAVHRLAGAMEAAGGSLVTADLACEVPGVTVVVAVALEGPTGAVAVGAKASCDRGSAVLGAAQEAMQALHLARSLRAAGRADAPPEIRTEEDRARFWASDAGVPALRTWVDSFRPPVDGPPPPAADPAELGDLLARRGTPVRVVDLTCRLPAPARELGWHAVKAVAPALQPLRIDETRSTTWRAARLDSAEIRTRCPSALAAGEVFDVPHPLV